MNNRRRMCEHFSMRENKKACPAWDAGRAFVLHGGAAVMLVAMLRPGLDCGWCVRGLPGDGFRRGGLGVCVDASASSVGGTVAFR